MAKEYQWWNPFDGDVIPGINVRNGIKQLATGQDYDVLDGVSTGKNKRQGQTHLAMVPDVGVRKTPFNPTGQEQPSGSKFIDYPTPAPTGETVSDVRVDPAYQAFFQQQARQAADTAEAQRIRGSILGRRGEIRDILNTILGNIQAELGEAKGRRTRQFDRDVDSLVASLDSAIPDIQNAFAAMGLSNSTYKGDRVQDTRDSYGKSWEDTNRQLNEDLTGFQRNAASKSAEANTNANKMFGALDEVEGMKASADNLGQLKDFNSQSRNALADFNGEKSKFMPGSEALRAISALNSNYDFGKTLDTFNAFASDKAAPSGNGVGGGKAKAGQIYEDDKKKNKTEVQINNPVGAASA